MQVITEKQLVAKIEDFLVRHGMAETTFGALAKGEPQFLDKLRRGRSPSLRVAGQVADFMADRDAALHAAADSSTPETSSAGMIAPAAPRVAA